jgi:CDP-glucose 4,6-dehydratase
MRYLITGHTGFKGSWLSLILHQLGHEVYGLSLEPIPESHYSKAELSNLFVQDSIIDIRDKIKVKKLIKESQPEVVIHLAAQPLVSVGYQDPFNTFSVNVDGTTNVLEGICESDTVLTTLIVTTDKVYRNLEEKRPFNELDSLGGTDPYSASKSMADLLTQSIAHLHTDRRILIARAGNVIGGGDYSENRLIPDLYKALELNEAATLRNPQAVRPWQHVLDCLFGYLMLIESTPKIDDPVDPVWNFGPEPSGYKSVVDLVDEFNLHSNRKVSIELGESDFKESQFLTLDSSKAKQKLGWSNKLDFTQTIKWTVDWYEHVESSKDSLSISRRQIEKYLSI